MTDGLRTLWNHGVSGKCSCSARGGSVVTLIPVGLLNLLPLHAAGEPGAPGDELTEWRHAGQLLGDPVRAECSRSPACRDTARQLADRAQTLLAIDVPDGHGLAPGGHLRYVATGDRRGHATLDGTGGTSRSTPARGRQFFDGSRPAHRLAPRLPRLSQAGLHSGQRLYFADRPGDVGGATPYAGAESTTPRGTVRVPDQPQRLRLPNEVVGLPSALIQVGFAGVIATAWTVDDLATTYLMTAFYQRWCGDGDEPAVALNRAQRWLRAATRADLTALLPDVEPRGAAAAYPYVDPRYWAAFAYTGA